MTAWECIFQLISVYKSFLFYIHFINWRPWYKIRSFEWRRKKKQHTNKDHMYARFVYSVCSIQVKGKTCTYYNMRKRLYSAQSSSVWNVFVGLRQIIIPMGAYKIHCNEIIQANAFSFNFWTTVNNNTFLCQRRKKKLIQTSRFVGKWNVCAIIVSVNCDFICVLLNVTHQNSNFQLFATK